MNSVAGLFGASFSLKLTLDEIVSVSLTLETALAGLEAQAAATADYIASLLASAADALAAIIEGFTICGIAPLLISLIASGIALVLALSAIWEVEFIAGPLIQLSVITYLVAMIIQLTLQIICLEEQQAAQEAVVAVGVAAASAAAASAVSSGSSGSAAQKIQLALQTTRLRTTAAQIVSGADTLTDTLTSGPFVETQGLITNITVEEVPVEETTVLVIPTTNASLNTVTATTSAEPIVFIDPSQLVVLGTTTQGVPSSSVRICK